MGDERPLDLPERPYVGYALKPMPMHTCLICRSQDAVGERYRIDYRVTLCPDCGEAYLTAYRAAYEALESSNKESTND